MCQTDQSFQESFGRKNGKHGSNNKMSSAREVLRFYREYTSSVPDELTAYAPS